MKWIYNEVPRTTAVEELQEKLGVKAPFPEVLAKILVQKGVDTFDKAKAFLKPSLELLHDPWQMRDMEIAIQRILKAISEQEKILIYGDYDVDGTTSVTLLTLFFQDFGLQIPYYIPERYTEGYGVSYEGIDYAKEQEIGLIIALDCGTKAVEKIKYARNKGIDFIVVDHHTPGTELPPVVAMVNPRHPECSYPFKELPACGLGLKLIQALAARLPELGDLVQTPIAYDPLARFADLVCLSIACDIVPLTGENRIIAYHGLVKLQQAPLPGLAALMRLADENREWNISGMVFFLGPRINSAGRLGTARDAVRLLLGQDGDLASFAADLHSYNDERKALDQSITEEALALIEGNPAELQRKSTVLYQPEWHKGVIGIVASRLTERHYRPTILLTRSGPNWVGSGRSVSDFDLYAALEQCKEYIVQFGGHKYAAGLTLSDDHVADFKAKFETVVTEHITEDQLVPKLKIAGRLPLTEVQPKLIRLIKRFAPFGPGNGEPVFEARGVEVLDARVLKKAHVRFLLRQHGVSIEAIGFSLAHRWAEVNSLRLDIAFQPDFKTWGGKTYIQLKLKDFRVAQS